jgi:hypothetical protein
MSPMKLLTFTKRIKPFSALMLFLFLMSLVACKGGKSEKDLTDDSDDTVYISDELLEEGEETEDYETIEDGYNENTSYSGPIEAPDSYKNYSRLDDSPAEFAKATVWHAINMLYPEPFNQPNAEVLFSNQEGDRLNIQMKISWSDRWAGPYIIEGVLEINTDGSNGVFTITSKNLNAQSLEFTYEGATNKKILPIL